MIEEKITIGEEDYFFIKDTKNKKYIYEHKGYLRNIQIFSIGNDDINFTVLGYDIYADEFKIMIDKILEHEKTEPILEDFVVEFLKNAKFNNNDLLRNKERSIFEGIFYIKKEKIQTKSWVFNDDFFLYLTYEYFDTKKKNQTKSDKFDLSLLNKDIQEAYSIYNNIDINIIKSITNNNNIYFNKFNNIDWYIIKLLNAESAKAIYDFSKYKADNNNIVFTDENNFHNTVYYFLNQDLYFFNSLKSDLKNKKGFQDFTKDEVIRFLNNIVSLNKEFAIKYTKNKKIIPFNHPYSSSEISLFNYIENIIDLAIELNIDIKKNNNKGMYEFLYYALLLKNTIKNNKNFNLYLGLIGTDNFEQEFINKFSIKKCKKLIKNLL